MKTQTIYYFYYKKTISLFIASLIGQQYRIIGQGVKQKIGVMAKFKNTYSILSPVPAQCAHAEEKPLQWHKLCSMAAFFLELF